ncbi:hypothetical protein CK203_008556 [Vitis vinifera]|uniref:Reverse transcriptase zinc-binding domain-containing protein n=1 Tax=Vitis vinifera TaxID=29760 RepID=A0A438KDP2_VITVI|nr:hypothetical protein CK203_008556 [Vitis vinifera]
MEYHLEVLGSFEGEFFCLGGVLEQNSDHRPAEKRGWNILNRCLVAQLWEQTGEVGHWNPVFTRLNKDWEMRELKAFFRGLHEQVLRRDDEDVMSWRVSKKDLFTVKSFYSLVPCNAREFPSSIVWNPGWAMPYSVKETILSWHSSFVGKKRKKAWNS